MHNKLNKPGWWLPKVEKLLNGETPLWFEHPTLGAKADFVAIKLMEIDDVQLYPYNLVNTGPNIMVGPADSVSVVGFPFGIQAGGSLAVWATGFMASEPDIDFKDLPVFLIDCRSREGQSGSAVIAYRSGGSVTMEDGSMHIYGKPVTKFLGIYSGRINPESDLGMVWKASAIKELVDSLKP